MTYSPIRGKVGVELQKVQGLVARQEVSLHELSSATDIEKARDRTSRSEQVRTCLPSPRLTLEPCNRIEAEGTCKTLPNSAPGKIPGSKD